MEDLFARLNEEQISAVTTTEGYVAVIAGAGSGKTRALTYRFAFLVNELGIRPGNILCITFTRKAANEIRERLKNMIQDSDTGLINTFHGFCVTVLHEDSHAVAYPKNFMVLDNSDIDAILDMIYEERGITLRDCTYAHARDMFEMRKCVDEPRYYEYLIDESIETVVRRYQEATDIKDILFYGYLYYERKCFGLDYNDLIILTLHIFHEHPEIHRKWQMRLEYIMIDEFQDIDPLQYELMTQLCGYHDNLFVVGDPDQTIYTWRGARISYILEFENKFPSVQEIRMMRNYRSSEEICTAANALIARNRNRVEKDLIPMNGSSGPVVYNHCGSAEDEAVYIAKTIRQHVDSGGSYRDIAILYRSHFVTRPIEEEFVRRRIPYRMYSGMNFYERAEIKEALCWMRMCAYQDDMSLLRIVNRPKRNIGRRRIQALKEYAESSRCTLYAALKALADSELFRATKAAAFIELVEKFRAEAERLPASEFLQRILEESGYEAMLRTEGAQDRLDNLAELKQSVSKFEVTGGEETDVYHYLDQVSFLNGTEDMENSDSVRMLTVHSAKGLEFPVVILCGMSEGIFPSRRTASQRQMEEERRLAFVACTRAEKKLIITDAGGVQFGAVRYPSRFIFDIGLENLSCVVPLPDPLVKEARLYAANADKLLQVDPEDTAYKNGDRVEHAWFGSGVIQETDYRKGYWIVRFDATGKERTIPFSMKEKLKRPE